MPDFGPFVSSDPNGRAAMYIHISEEASFISSNESRMRVRAWVRDNSASFGGFGTANWSVSAVGRTWSGSMAFDFTGNSGRSYTFLDTNLAPGGGELRITHNADGSASAGISCSWNTNQAGNTGVASGSGTIYSPTHITDFDFTAGPPNGVSASYVPGSGVTVSWGSSVSYKQPVTYYVSYRESSDGGATFGAWSGEATTTGNSFFYGSLTLDRVYQFRVRAYNGFDFYSGYVESNTVFVYNPVPPTLTARLHNGSNFTVRDGYSYADGDFALLDTLKVYDGATRTWKDLAWN